MAIKGIIKKGQYFDSVSLMNTAKAVNQLDGVQDSAVVMGTKSNKDILESSGMLLPEFTAAEDSDLLIAVKSDSESAALAALAGVDDLLKQSRKSGGPGAAFLPRSIDGAVGQLPQANLALISVAGRYAGDEAQKALRLGLNVMLFSDNVPLEKEIELKRYAAEKGLLVMGPDCGTAIIDGVPLAFANVVDRGAVGIVAASGTGLQEVSCLISNHGAGISQAIGTGGRDVKKEVGGIMFIQALRMLARDDDTSVIVLVSKPPHPEVMERIGSELKGVKKPVAAVFLGADPNHVANLLSIFNASVRPDSDMHALAVETVPGPTMGAIEEAIQRLDVPSAASKNIEITAYLLIGSETAGTEPSAMPKELDSVVAQLKNAFAFKSYRLLDTLALRTRVGQAASTNSSGRGAKSGDNTPLVRTQFRIASAGIGSDETTIRIDKLILDSNIPVPTGVGGQFNMGNVGLQADVDIKQGQKVVIGRVSVAESALFLVLTAQVVN